MTKNLLSYAVIATFFGAGAAQADNIHNPKQGTLTLQHVRTAGNNGNNSWKGKGGINAYAGKSAAKTQETQYK
jgi:hypothetical protein